LYAVFRFIGAVSLFAYLLVSFVSALRMYFVHRIYVHIEFNQKKWRSFGHWAPRRLRLLTQLRRWAAVGLLSWATAAVVAMLR
jgi:hypothetical protein